MMSVTLNPQISPISQPQKTKQVYSPNRTINFGNNDEFSSSKTDKREKPSLITRLTGMATLPALLLTASLGLNGYNLHKQNQMGETLSDIIAHQNELHETLNNEIETEIKPYTLKGLENVAEKAKASTALIQIIQTDKSGKIEQGTGSGFLIAPDILLTSAHVLGKDKFAALLGFTDAEETVAVTNKNVLAIDPNYDLAAIKLPKGTILPKSVKPLILSRINPKSGEAVATIGAPLGLIDSFSAGVISNTERAFAQATKAQVLQTDINFNPGNSGGPLLNIKGEVIGINSAALAESSGMGFSVDVNSIKEFLKEHKINLPESE